MDPDETWKLVTDESLPLDERGQAALDLLVWLAKGGALPEYTTGVRPETMLPYVVEQCQIVMSKMLDAVQAYEVVPGHGYKVLSGGDPYIGNQAWWLNSGHRLPVYIKTDDVPVYIRTDA